MIPSPPAIRTSIGASRLLFPLAPAIRSPIPNRCISSTAVRCQNLQHLHPSEGAGQTLQAPNTSSTAADAVTAALGTSKPPVGASSNSTVLGMDELKVKAKKLYKELHRLGRDYPDPEYGFNKRLRRAYEKNSKLTDPAALSKQLELAEHIKKEVLALISLKKFRHLRRSYHANEGPR